MNVIFVRLYIKLFESSDLRYNSVENSGFLNHEGLGPKELSKLMLKNMTQ